MAKPEWGQKHTCGDCGARFYDLKRDIVPCPRCGTEFAAAAPAKARRAVRSPPSKVEPAPAPDESGKASVADDADDDAAGKEIAGDDGDDGDEDLEAEEEELIEDTSDLGQDDDDMAEAREHIESDDNKDKA